MKILHFAKAFQKSSSLKSIFGATKKEAKHLRTPRGKSTEDALPIKLRDQWGTKLVVINWKTESTAEFMEFYQRMCLFTYANILYVYIAYTCNIYIYIYIWSPPPHDPPQWFYMVITSVLYTFFLTEKMTFSYFYFFYLLRKPLTHTHTAYYVSRWPPHTQM